MESGRDNPIERSIRQSEEAHKQLMSGEIHKNVVQSLVDLCKPYQEEFNRLMYELQERMIYGIPKVYHTDSEGNQRLLSIEETLILLSRDTKYQINPDIFLKESKNSIDLEDKDGE